MEIPLSLKVDVQSRFIGSNVQQVKRIPTLLNVSGRQKISWHQEEPIQEIITPSQPRPTMALLPANQIVSSNHQAWNKPTMQYM